MKVEARMAEARDPIAKFIQRSGAAAQRGRDFHALAKIESLQRGLARKVWIRGTIVGNHAAQISAQRGDRNVIANVEHRKLFSEIVPVGVRKHPLGEIVRKTFRQKMMATQCLEGVMKNRRVAAVLQPRQQLRECASRLVADACEI